VAPGAETLEEKRRRGEKEKRRRGEEEKLIILNVYSNLSRLLTEKLSPLLLFSSSPLLN
jgi:hypothetical protein